MTARKEPFTFLCGSCLRFTTRWLTTSVLLCTECRLRLWREQNRAKINEQGRARREANAEHYRRLERERNAANPLKGAERQRRYRAANLEKRKATERHNYWTHREAKIAKSTRWNQANAQLRAAREADRRATIAGAFIEAVHPLVVLELADGLCGICGLDVDVSEYQVDHIDPISLGGEHSYSNTQPAHPLCNMSKGNRVAA